MPLILDADSGATVEGGGSSHASMWQFGRSKRRRNRPRLPPGVRVYAIGDVHGRVDLLEKVLSRIDVDLAGFPQSAAIEVFIGDYIDRGPGSRKVLDRLIKRSQTGRTVFLKGNHETYIAQFLQDPAALAGWQHLGGLETLMSYGLKPTRAPDVGEQQALAKALAHVFPTSHAKFLANLRPSFTCGDFFFVHAGVRPRVPLEQQREDDLLCIREDFLLSEENFGKIVVHGHTPVSEPDIRFNRINIDTGAYATGRLTCLLIEGEEIFSIT
jgi:calcineurin-like phosphoesterase family protein